MQADHSIIQCLRKTYKTYGHSTNSHVPTLKMNRSQSLPLHGLDTVGSDYITVGFEFLNKTHNLYL